MTIVAIYLIIGFVISTLIINYGFKYKEFRDLITLGSALTLFLLLMFFYPIFITIGFIAALNHNETPNE